MPHLQFCSIDISIATFNSKLRSLFDDSPFNRLDHQSFQCLELAVHALARWLADMLVYWFLFQFVKQCESQVIQARRNDGNFQLRGRRDVHLRLLGGHSITLNLAHGCVPKSKHGPKRKQGKRRRGAGHRNVPVLSALGFLNRTSPAACSLVARRCAGCDSFDFALATLGEQGINLSKEQGHNLFKIISNQMMSTRDQWLAGKLELNTGFEVEGRDVVIAFDGGRIRQREDKKGRKKSNVYNNFDAPWVEPRQLVIYTLKEDGSGKYDSQNGKLTDGMSAQVDEIMRFLGSYLKAIEISKVRRVIVVADGQFWQWDRISALLESLGVKEVRKMSIRMRQRREFI